jgi:cytoskeletal protein RodZ
MPLDTGDLAFETKLLHGADDLASARSAPLVLDSDLGLGEALAAARRSRGLRVEDITRITRIRGPYVAAIEAFDLAALPSRPFVIGFIRAYGRALGLDAESVVARFRAEAPDPQACLQAPVKVDHQNSWASRLVVLAASVIVVSVVGWNLWRHAHAEGPRSFASAPLAPASSNGLNSVTLGAPLPTPPEASAPPAYQTPGLSPDTAAEASQGAEATENSGKGTTPGPLTEGARFQPQGAVYGATSSGAGVILQARAPTALIVRGPDGAVIFAREMAKGEAYRAPATVGVTANVDSPSAMEVFVGGVAHGVLTDARTSLAHIAD